MIGIDLMTGEPFVLDRKDIELELTPWADNRFVNVTGDTMTGGLTIQPATDILTALVVNDKDANNVLTVDTVNNRVGIRTTNPSLAKFQIEAGNGVVGQYINGGTTVGTDLLKLRANALTQRLILEGKGGTVQTFLEAGGSIGLFGTVTNHDFRIRTNYVDRMTFDTKGNVGIGTTTPQKVLHVHGNTNGLHDMLVQNESVGSQAQARIRLVAGGYSANNGVVFGITGVNTQWAGNAYFWNIDNTSFMFATNNTERMRLSSTGNLGIGTTSPTQKLDVNGKIAINGAQTIYNAGALNSNFSGSIFIGDGGNSLSYSSGDDGRHNTGVGSRALNSITSGSFNSAFGRDALYVNTSGVSNTAIGVGSNQNNTTSSANVSVGNWSLYTNKTGSNGVAIGYESQRYVNDTTTPWTNYNTSVGYQSLKGSTTASNNTGNYNTTVGYQGLYSVTSGSSNSGFGYNSLYYNTSGAGNTGLGYFTLCNLTGTFNNNISIGYNAGRYYNGTIGDLTQISNSILIGASASALDNGSTNEIVIGYSAIGKGSNTVVLGNADITDVYLSSDIGATVHAGKFKLGALNTAPASASDTGTQGEIRFTADAIYFCIATDTWVKTTLASW